MMAAGAHREAEVVLHGVLARDPQEAECRAAMGRLDRGEPMPPGPATEPTLEIVDEWIREGMLVEALAVLAAGDLGGPASEWADLLGELLAPVPAHAEGAFVEMHRQLLRGGASVALTILEDRLRQGPVPAWAERRLELLRWMLLDNARSAPASQAPAGEAPTELAAALRAGLAERSVEAMRERARAFAEAHPGDADAADAVRVLELLAGEMASLDEADFLGAQTVPVMGRPAAAMQLRMANLEGAKSIYGKLASKQPGGEVQALADAVRGLLRLLEGRPIVDRSFPPPPKEPRSLEVELGIAPAFADKTALDEAAARLAAGAGAESTKVVENPLAPFDEETRVLETPAEELPREAGSGGPARFEDDTRPVSEDELPLDAFREDRTVEIPIPQDLADGDADGDVDDDKPTQRFDRSQVEAAMAKAGAASPSSGSPAQSSASPPAAGSLSEPSAPASGPITAPSEAPPAESASSSRPPGGDAEDEAAKDFRDTDRIDDVRSLWPRPETDIREDSADDDPTMLSPETAVRHDEGSPLAEPDVEPGAELGSAPPSPAPLPAADTDVVVQRIQRIGEEEA
ncbi:MAG: hypothetical protein CMN31_13865 [Sandaracinus sp.]|nr:hypothetical protein [Myxococcales bacterium]MBJ72400.1 hypothetical protein [Sandaracinus sp.]